MKRFIIMLICAALAATAIYADASASPVSAASTARINWFCVNNKTHSQPRLDPALAVIEKHNAVWIDKNHGDDCADGDKVLYLTFDAGYENGNVARILDTLRDEKVTGAFFILGHLAEAHGELVKRMSDEGHLVCNHTASHKNMSGVGDINVFRDELDRLNEIVKTSCGVEVAPFYRPPEGAFSEANLSFADELGYKTVFWSFAYADWDNDRQPSREQAMEKVLAHTHNGAVILLHPTSATNAEILGDLIREWKAQGYRFGSLYDL